MNAREQVTTTRQTYVQCSLLSRGVSLTDLRDLVAATRDYDPRSRVEVEGKKITVTEVNRGYWLKRGEEFTDE